MCRLYSNLDAYHHALLSFLCKLVSVYPNTSIIKKFYFRKSQSSGYADEGYRDTGRGDKRKMDYDDYGQESTKRVASYGQPGIN